MTPSTDIRRTCAKCGALTYCCIVRKVHLDKKYQVQVERAEAVCPKCMEVAHA